MKRACLLFVTIMLVGVLTARTSVPVILTAGQSNADALRRLARDDRHFHVVEATDLPLLRDRLHFNAEGAQTLGQRVFDKMKQQKIVK